MYEVTIKNIDVKRSATALANTSLQAFIDAQKHIEAEPCYVPCSLEFDNISYPGIYWHDAFICNYNAAGFHNNLTRILPNLDVTRLIEFARLSIGRVWRMDNTSRLQLTETPCSHIAVRDEYVPDDTFELGSLVIFKNEPCYISTILYDMLNFADGPRYTVRNCKNNEIMSVVPAKKLTTDPYNSYFYWRYENA